MEKYLWKENYSVKIEIIDEQHKKLFSLLNNLVSSMNGGIGNALVKDILIDLKNYSEFHFKEEEGMLRKYDYENLTEHIKEHQYYINKIIELTQLSVKSSSLVSLKTADFLRDWLIQHILGTDKEYQQFLLSKGVK